MGTANCTADIKKHCHEPQRCALTDLATLRDGATPKFIADCEEYFSHFVKPIRRETGEKEHLCFHCGEPLTGLFAMVLGRGGFTWGIAHGEGFCANCKWPARAYHFAKNSDGEELFTVRNLVLQYHPDEVTAKTEPVSAS